MSERMAKGQAQAMKVCLFALTGMGNSVLRALEGISNIERILLFSRSEKGPYPYFKCDHISRVRTSKTVIRIDADVAADCVEEEVKEFSPDMIIAATFDKRISERIIMRSRHIAVNIHPSLLPAYRGPTPTNWAVVCGDKKSGVTFHLLAREYDTGDILFQRESDIIGLTDGEVRCRLFSLAGEMIPEFIKLAATGGLKPVVQDARAATVFPKIGSEAGLNILRSGRYSIDNIRRGVTPVPGMDVVVKEGKHDNQE